jgi:DNA replication and repair protein RecF
VQVGHDEAVLEARVDRGGHGRVVRIDIRGGAKDVYLNNSWVRQLSEFFGTVNVVKFGPEDTTLLRGSPSDRRDFIDRAIYNARPAYQSELDGYEDVRKQRNALLKQPGGAEIDESLLSVYDEQLIQHGADIVMRRLEFIEQFRPVLNGVFGQIFDPKMTAGVHYEMKWADGIAEIPIDPANLDEPRRPAIERALERALDETEQEERDRGYTVIGPHRDDLVGELNGRDMSVFGSQGQHRAFILAMKIAVITFWKEQYHFAPILLLDDVSSELDRERNERLFEFLREETDGQVFITTTHRDFIHLDDDLKVFRVDAGDVSERE